MSAILPVTAEQSHLLEARGVAPAADGTALVALGDGDTASGLVEWSAQAFESEQLGFPVARIDRLIVWDDAASLDALIEKCLTRLRAERVRLVSCRVAEDAAQEHAALERAGFSAVEHLLTLARPLPQCAPEGPIAGLMRDGEQDSCAALAGRVFVFDRFHADPEIADDLADRLKARWVRNACTGRADAVLVARDGDRVVGFNTCMRRGNTAIIDLIGVDLDARGRGHGRALVDGALAHYAGRADEMIVGTQATNLPSLALYRACGFKRRETRITFHAHLHAHL